MYIPSHFSQSKITALHDLIRAQPLASLITIGPHGLNANHIPMLLHTEPEAPERGTLRAHIARTNPMVKETEGDVLAIFQGPNTYITPTWYDTQRDNEVVPTWNFIAVHVYGKLRFIHDAIWLRTHLEEMVAHSEAPFQHQWKISDAPQDFVNGLLQGIVGIEISVSRMEGKWKVSQNQPEYNRDGVVKGLTERGTETDLHMARIINENPPLRR